MDIEEKILSLMRSANRPLSIKEIDIYLNLKNNYVRNIISNLIKKDKIAEIFDKDKGSCFSLKVLDNNISYETEYTREEDSMEYKPTVFISYSWDSEEHQRWVINLTNKLLENGIDATNDIFETQKGTINLNTMMVKNIKDKDYTIIVLTEKYCRKADSLEGGVGRETKLLLNYIQENEDKMIPIIKSINTGKKPIPFYLEGMSYIDFSNKENFQKDFKELLHRIYKVDLFKKSKLGKRPNLETLDTSLNLEGTSYDLEEMIPNFKEVTDIEKNQFIKESFMIIVNGLENLLDNTKRRNNEFDFEREDITSRKTLYKLYLNGKIKTTTKIWIGNNLGWKNETINISYDSLSIDTDNSMNEIITCEVDESKKLKLKMTMNIFGNRQSTTPEIVLKSIWESIINRVR